MELYIGLMSGTSADGIDAALVDFSGQRPQLAGSHYAPYSSEVRQRILALCQPGDNEIHRLGEMDILLGKAFADAVNTLLQQSKITANHIQAIGSHGQTVRHHPQAFTLQIGDPNTIAAQTGITTIADFRRKDVAYGGHGAPLVPAFHQQVLASDKIHRAIVNIGGMANVTLLPAATQTPVTGFDTGPGNVLLDHWIHTHQQESHDRGGAWGAQGRIEPHLLKVMLDDPYFKLPPPKSTGREYFNPVWLAQCLQFISTEAVNVQATLTELTARTIVDAIHSAFSCGEILVCGGGAHNAFLMSRIKTHAAPQFEVTSTADHGIHPDWMEAMAFAWLARQTLNRLPGNLPSVTGAKQSVILGGIYYS